MRRVLPVILLVFLCSMTVFGQVKGSVPLTAVAVDTTPTVGDTECGIASVQFYIAGVPLGPAIVDPPYIYLWDTTKYPNGTYSLTAKATDKAGLAGACDGTKVNVGTSTALNLVVNNISSDTTAPTVVIQTPISASIKGREQNIKAEATDESQVAKMELLLNGTTKAVVFNETDLEFKWKTAPYKGRFVEVRILATDDEGNIGEARKTVQVSK